MKKALIIISTIISTSVLLLFPGCDWDNESYEGEKAELQRFEEEVKKDYEKSQDQVSEEQGSKNNDNEKFEESNSEINKPEQSGTLTFDNSNSKLGCSVWASIITKQKDSKDREYESSMILTAGSSQMEENPTQHNIVFDLDKGTITGGFDGDYYRQEEEEEAFDYAEIDATIANGTVIWDAAQKVWLFEADADMIVFLEIKNKLGEEDKRILYGDANLSGIITGKLTGASGEHQRQDHHGELQSRSSFLTIYYEKETPPLSGNAEVSSLIIECWLEMPFGEDMGSKFPTCP